jgi:hypothetical protein
MARILPTFYFMHQNELRVPAKSPAKGMIHGPVGTNFSASVEGGLTADDSA